MTQQTAAGRLFGRLIDLSGLWRDIVGDNGVADSFASLDPSLPPSELERVRLQMRACLEGKGGEVSARRRAAALGQGFLNLDSAGRAAFLSLMAREFGPDPIAVDAAIARLTAGEDRAASERALRATLEPPWIRLLTQFNDLPEGVKFLVDLRSELMGLVRRDPTMAPLEEDLRALLASWFDVGFLELVRLTWRSPAAVLEKIIAYEAVHQIHGWDDLKNRLDSDRRLYAFIHPRMPEEPLIFVEVALVRGMSGSIQELLDQGAPVADPAAADTAIFYSISNAQKGLAGISFGNFLIKRVVETLSAEFPKLSTFATLSPIPGFRKWLDERLAEGEPGLLTSTEHRALNGLAEGRAAKGSLKAALSHPDWHRDPEVSSVLKAPLTRLCARYLGETREKGERRRALDNVAHFHLTNGARMERLNWLGDVSPNGLRQSAGLMINYLYKLSDIDRNHEAYSGQGKIAMSSPFKTLQRG